MKDAADREQAVDDWLSGELSNEQRQQFISKLRTDAELQQALLQRATLERQLQLLQPEINQSAPKPTAQGNHPGRRRPNPRTRVRRSARRLRPRSVAVALAASLLIIVIISLTPTKAPVATLVTGHFRDWQDHNIPAEQPIIARNKVTLSTASNDQLTLNPGTSIIFNKGEDVNVTLQHGQVHTRAAARSNTKGLTISTPELGVTVLGTEFSVSRNELGSRVQVHEGSVPIVSETFDGALHASESIGIAASRYAFPDHWDHGTPTPDGVHLLPDDTTLSAGFGIINQNMTVIPYHPELRIRFQYRVNEHCRWLGIWFRVPATGTNYYLPLGKVTAHDDWTWVEARLGDATANGPESRSLQNGDVLSVFRIQTGNLNSGGAAIIRQLEPIPGK